MLKKVGIVATAATAAMIALSPLAFAHHDDEPTDETTNVSIEDSSVERNQSNECEFDQDVTNTSPLLGVVPLPTQIQTLNCVNIGDDGVLPAPAPEPAPEPDPVPVP